MNFSRKRLSQATGAKNQSGFTLMEMIVVLAVITIVAGLSLFAYNGDKAKATELYSKMSQYGSAMSRMKLDTACLPTKTGALYDQTLADESFCNKDLRANWRGPYIKAGQLHSNNQDLSLTEFAPGAYLSISLEDNINGNGNTRQWTLTAHDIPEDIAAVAMEICNKGYTDANQTAFKQGNCVSPVDVSGGSDVTTFRYIFDERP